MGIIHVLDEHVANLIAAGEVVERPASVVKELVENAIDADADQVRIQIEEGGLTLIRVTDNGRGIAPEDVPTAFQRHATSKVRDSRDLHQIRTLGFRGEALPSIASVARVELITSTDKSGLGKICVIEGGEVKKIEDIRTTKGTDITVRDLFYNTPARLKYMKTIQTEFGHISDYIYRLAFAHPNIAFTLVHNDKLVLRTPGGGDLLQTIAAVYGTAAARSMLRVQAEDADFTLFGWIGKPELTRANRYGMTTIVNGRYVRSYALQTAIVQAYHTLLPINRYPLVVLQLTMDPSLVDVNVHPAKLEVRFSKERELMKFIETELGRVLRGADLIPRLRGHQERQAVIQEQLKFQDSVPTRGSGSETQERQEGGRMMRRGLDGLYQPRTADLETGTIYNGQAGRRATASPLKSSTPDAASVDWQPYLEIKEPAASPESRRLPQLRVIGQVHGTYIIAENEEGLFLIDQHAAHERINYERFYRKFGQPEQVSQELLVPITMEFTPSEAEVLRSRSALFSQIGVYFEPFGGNTFIIRSVPEWMPKGEELEILQEITEWVLQDRSLDIAKLREQSAILTACKASLKANDYLSREEIESLLAQLAACDNPFTCPHGRPVIVSFSTYELEKMFKRVM